MKPTPAYHKHGKHILCLATLATHEAYERRATSSRCRRYFWIGGTWGVMRGYR